MNATERDDAIAAMPGEKVTADYMKSRLADINFMALPHTTVTICSLTLDNGFSVRGESACVDPANFNAEIGKDIAFDRAFEKLWPLFGFLLAEERMKRVQAPAALPWPASKE